MSEELESCRELVFWRGDPDGEGWDVAAHALVADGETVALSVQFWP
jgi:hypothetical protein